MLQGTPPFERVQAVRSVCKSQVGISTVPSPGDVIHIDCHIDPATQKEIVLWDDIRQAFEDALHARHKSRVVPFLKGADLRPLEPRRIAAVPHAVLDIIVEDPLVRSEASQSKATPPSKTLLEEPQDTLQNEAIVYRRDPSYGLEKETMASYNLTDSPHTTPLSLSTQFPSSRQQDDHSRPTEITSEGLGTPTRAPQDHTTAATVNDITPIIVKATFGDRDAQVTLGNKHRNGDGVEKDNEAAHYWYLKAAND
ncbi:hypothetical protein BGX23_004250, partial [Mortierella sp. AD031]